MAVRLHTPAGGERLSNASNCSTTDIHCPADDRYAPEQIKVFTILADRSFICPFAVAQLPGTVISTVWLRSSRFQPRSLPVQDPVPTQQLSNPTIQTDPTAICHQLIHRIQWYTVPISDLHHRRALDNLVSQKQHLSNLATVRARLSCRSISFIDSTTLLELTPPNRS